jgi:hypothetical protein
LSGIGRICSKTFGCQCNKKPNILLITTAIILAVVALIRLSLPALGSSLVADDEPQQSLYHCPAHGQRPGSELGAVELYSLAMLMR